MRRRARARGRRRRRASTTRARTSWTRRATTTTTPTTRTTSRRATDAGRRRCWRGFGGASSWTRRTTRCPPRTRTRTFPDTTRHNLNLLHCHVPIYLICQVQQICQVHIV